MGSKFSMKQLLNDKSISVNSGPKAAFPIQTIDIDSIVPDERNFYIVDNVDMLKDAIQMDGLEQNLVVRKDAAQNKYVLISGHRRFKALRLLVDEGHEEFRAIPCKVSVAESLVDDIKTELRMIFGNATTRTLTEYEKTQQYVRMKELLKELKRNGEKIPGRMRDLIADTLQTSPSKVGRMENIAGNLAPELQGAFKSGAINMSVANELSGLPQNEQREIFDKHSGSGSITVNDVKQYKASPKKDKQMQPPAPPAPAPVAPSTHLEPEADPQPTYIPELDSCPLCGKILTKVTYEETRIYRTECKSCKTTFLHESTSYANAVLELNRRHSG